MPTVTCVYCNVEGDSSKMYHCKQCQRWMCAKCVKRHVDPQGRSYLTCMFLDRPFADLDPDQEIGSQAKTEAHRLFIDGSVDTE